MCSSRPSAWNPNFPAANGHSIPTGASQLDPLSWPGLDEIRIVFSEDVNVQQGDLLVRGVNVPVYAIDGFSYDAATRTAIWTLAAPIDLDNVILELSDQVTDQSGAALDGEWTNGVSMFSSGDGVAGGAFEFRINVLPGDVNQTGSVFIDDVILVRNAQFTAPGAPGYSNVLDYNGSRRHLRRRCDRGSRPHRYDPVAQRGARRGRRRRRDGRGETTVTIDVLGNDDDFDNDPLSVSAVTQGANGIVVVNADDTIDYAPNLDFRGVDNFTYTIDDGHGGMHTATVTVTVANLTVTVQSITITSDPVAPVLGFLDLFFSVPVDLSQAVAGYNSGLPIVPSGAGISLLGAAEAPNALFPGQDPLVFGSGDELLVSDNLPGIGEENLVFDGAGLYRVLFEVAPGASGVFDLDQNLLLLFDGLGVEVPNVDTVGGTITVAANLQSLQTETQRTSSPDSGGPTAGFFATTILVSFDAGQSTGAPTTVDASGTESSLGASGNPTTDPQVITQTAVRGAGDQPLARARKRVGSADTIGMAVDLTFAAADERSGAPAPLSFFDPSAARVVNVHEETEWFPDAETAHSVQAHDQMPPFANGEQANPENDATRWYFDTEAGHATRAHLFARFADGADELFLGIHEIGSNHAFDSVEAPSLAHHSATDLADLDSALANDVDRFDLLFESTGEQTDSTSTLFATSLILAGASHAARKRKRSPPNARTKATHPQRHRL